MKPGWPERQIGMSYRSGYISWNRFLGFWKVYKFGLCPVAGIVSIYQLIPERSPPWRLSNQGTQARVICKYFFNFEKYFIQLCFFSRPSDSTVSEDARTEPITVKALAMRQSDAETLGCRSQTRSARSLHSLARWLISNSARSHPYLARFPSHSARSHSHSARSHSKLS